MMILLTALLLLLALKNVNCFKVYLFIERKSCRNGLIILFYFFAAERTNDYFSSRQVVT